MPPAIENPLVRAAANRISTGRRLQYVQGYLALGMLAHAVQELGEIELKDRFSAPVVEARMDLLCEAKQWNQLIALAKDYAHLRPQHEKGRIMWAYALRELNRVREARTVLMDVDTALGKSSALLHYNLACYHCLLGEIGQARARLVKAFRLDQDLRLAAMNDADLKSLSGQLQVI